MYTSIVVIALASTLNAVQATENVAWQSEYKAAQAEVLKTGKPLAVFIGNGADGWTKVVREGTLPIDARLALTKNFVCLYVNTDTANGKLLANSFEIGSRGLVISDAKGAAQAFSHAGDLTQSELKNVLVKYSAPKAVDTTETLGRAGDGYVAKPTIIPATYTPSSVPSSTVAGTTISGNRYNGTPIYLNSSTNANCPDGRR